MGRDGAERLRRRPPVRRAAVHADAPPTPEQRRRPVERPKQSSPSLHTRATGKAVSVPIIRRLGLYETDRHAQHREKSRDGGTCSARCRVHPASASALQHLDSSALTARASPTRAQTTDRSPYDTGGEKSTLLPLIDGGRHKCSSYSELSAVRRQLSRSDAPPPHGVFVSLARARAFTEFFSSIEAFIDSSPFLSVYSFVPSPPYGGVTSFTSSTTANAYPADDDGTNARTHRRRPRAPADSSPSPACRMSSQFTGPRTIGTAKRRRHKKIPRRLQPRDSKTRNELAI